MDIIGQNEKSYFYYAYAMSAAILVASAATGMPALVGMSALLLLVSVILLNSGHIINNLLVRRGNIIEVSGNYKIGRGLGSISTKDGNEFKSVSIALLSPRSGSQIKAEVVKDLLDSITEHFEFSIELLEVNKAKILENLRTRLRMKEISLSRIGPKAQDKISSLKRQIDSINGDIDSLVSGGKSFQFAIKIKSICKSEDQSEAEHNSASSIEILASKFSASLGLDYEILRGERLLEYSGA